MSRVVGRTQGAMCAGMLGLQAVVLFLVTPVLLRLTDLGQSVALGIGIGLSVACVAAAGLMRRRGGIELGWAIQVCAVALGFVVPVMFALGFIFFSLYAGAFYLGRQIDQERAERSAQAPGA